MPSTTIHVPAKLLELIDSRSKAEGLSRNKFILRAIRLFIEDNEEWDHTFLEELKRPLPEAEAEAVDQMMRDIANQRSSKSPPPL